MLAARPPAHGHGHGHGRGRWRRRRPGVTLTRVAAASSSSTSPPPSPSPSSSSSSSPSPRLRLRAMQVDSQEIRVCALVLSVLAFFLFLAAELLPCRLETHAAVTTLAALATLGLAWTGPLTLLAGTMRSPAFQWWQPFQGGAAFVWLQAFGWTLHALVLTASVIVLANTSHRRGPPKRVEGQFLVLGIAGFVAQTLLNLSIGLFDHTALEDPRRARVQWNAKAVVSMLVAGSGALVMVLVDWCAQAPWLPSAALLAVAGAEFVLAAAMLHVFYGGTEIPGYRLWQPFQGGSTFLLLQYLGWQFLAATLVGTAMLYTAMGIDDEQGATSTPLHDSLALPRGTPSVVGAMGLISQILLLLSLQHFQADVTPRGRGRGRGFGHGVDPASHWPRQRREWWVASVLCLCSLGVGCLSYRARSVSNSRSTFEADWWAWFLLQERVLWQLSMLALVLATPITHLGGVRTIASYRWWQPFQGGTKYVFLQCLGWLWYAFFLVLSIVVHLNDPPLVNTMAVIALLLGCAATGAITLSVPHFQAPASSSSSSSSSASSSSLTSVQVPQLLPSPPTTTRSIRPTGEVAISVLMTLTCILCHAVVDYAPDQVTPPMRLLVLSLGVALLTLACTLTHASGLSRFAGYRLWQPFQGGGPYVVRQAIGWTLFGVELLLVALLSSLPVASLPLGVVTAVGCFALVPHVLLLISVGHFNPATRPLRPRSRQARAESISWQVLVRTQRPDLRWRVDVTAFCSLGALVLFAWAEALHHSARFGHAHAVLYAFACFASLAGITATHCSLARLACPGYRLFQPFLGGLRFVTYQGVAWTLVGVALVVASTALYWRALFLQVDGICVVTGLLFGVPQFLLVHSLSLFKAPTTTTVSTTTTTTTTTRHRPRPRPRPRRWSRLDKVAHEALVGPILGMAACLLFVVVDVAMLYWGPSLPVFPVTVCAVLALLSSIPLTYMCARSALATNRKKMGGSVVFLVLGCALWSVAILLGALFCLHVSGLEATSTTAMSVRPSTARGASSTHFMGTFTGSVGFVALFVFFQASGAKRLMATVRQADANVALTTSTRRPKRRLFAASLWLASLVFFLATALVCAYTTYFVPHQLPSHQLTRVGLCSLVVVALACWLQRQIVPPEPAASGAIVDRATDLDRAVAVFERVDGDCFAQMAEFLTVTELVVLSTTCRSLQKTHTSSFWQNQFTERFATRHRTLVEHALDSCKVEAEAAGEAKEKPARMQPAFIPSFAASWIHLVEAALLNMVCRLERPRFRASTIENSPAHAVDKWKALCIMKEKNLQCEHCRICHKVEVLRGSGQRWEQEQACPSRAPSTWVRLCACADPVTLNALSAHRACLESNPAEMERVLRPCKSCGCRVVASERFAKGMQELVDVTWADFCDDREPFAGGFFAVVPMSTCLVVLWAHWFSFGSAQLYVWIGFAMALCFVSNTPRLQRCLDRIGDDNSPSYLAFQRLFHALTLCSLTHVCGCIARTRDGGVVDTLLDLNFALLLTVVCTVLFIFWRTSYRLPTVESCRDHVQGAEDDASMAIASPQPGACIACLLQLCPRR